MGLIIGLSVIGLLLSAGSAGCTPAHLTNPNDAKLFGKIPWALIGGVGYALLAVTSKMPVVTLTLALIFACVTIWLIIKAIRLRLDCPFCPLVWVVNAVIVAVAFIQIKQV